MRNPVPCPTCRCPRADDQRALRGLTLLEVLVTVALLAALMAVTLPLVLSQTSRLTYTELLSQIERRAALVREDAQRSSGAIWFEARWLEDEGVWALGTRSMLTPEDSGRVDPLDLSSALLDEMETVMADDITDRAAMFADERDTMSPFEPVMRLPGGYGFVRQLPEELLEMKDGGPEVDEENALVEASSLVEDQEFLDPEAETQYGDEPPTRLLLAVFLPDGTLIGPERAYLTAPEKRLATVTMNRWLGSVRCETLTLSTLMEPGAADEPEQTDEPQDDRPAADDSAPSESPPPASPPPQAPPEGDGS